MICESRKPADKTVLREEVKTRRAELSPEERAEMSRMITSHLLDFLRDYGTVMAYASKEPEVDTFGLITALINRGTKVVVPIIQREDCSLRLSYLEDINDLTPSTFNVPEPTGHVIPAEPQDIDAVLIPLVGFDRSGNRLGYGAGYYDRFLSKNSGIVKIGIAFSCQCLETVPSEEFDAGMDFIVTEKGIIHC